MGVAEWTASLRRVPDWTAKRPPHGRGCAEWPTKRSDEVLTGYVDLTNRLVESELIDMFAAITSVTASSSSLVIATSLVLPSTAVVRVNGVSVSPGRALTFPMTGGTAGMDYTLTVSAITIASSNSLRMLKESLNLRVV